MFNTSRALRYLGGPREFCLILINVKGILGIELLNVDDEYLFQLLVMTGFVLRAEIGVLFNLN